MTEPAPQPPDPAQGDDRDVIDPGDVIDPAQFPPADGEG